MNIWGIFFCCLCIFLFNVTCLFVAIMEKNEDKQERRRAKRNFRHGMPKVRDEGGQNEKFVGMV